MIRPSIHLTGDRLWDTTFAIVMGKPETTLFGKIFVTLRIFLQLSLLGMFLVVMSPLFIALAVTEPPIEKLAEISEHFGV